jgi:hypothetical protein
VDRLKIFISSTMTDLQAERQAVEQAIANLRLEAVRAETLGSQPVPSRQACLEMARQCDIYLGIYGVRYGWVPPGDHVSVTEMEFQEARKQGKDILVYVKEVPEREEAQVEFLRRVEDFDEGYFRRPYFTTCEQLAEWVKVDIAGLVSRRYWEGEEEKYATSDRRLSELKQELYRLVERKTRFGLSNSRFGNLSGIIFYFRPKISQQSPPPGPMGANRKSWVTVK